MIRAPQLAFVAVVAACSGNATPAPPGSAPSTSAPSTSAPDTSAATNAIAPDPGDAAIAADPADAARDAAVAADMADAALRFLATLPPDVAKRARFSIDDAERSNWHYIPRRRRGVAIRELTDAQRAIAFGFLSTALGRRGLLKATEIMAMEQVLHDREHGAGSFVRDSGAYFLTIFGEPSTHATWGWRLEGHHLSINLTLADGTTPVVAPTFLGVSPSTTGVLGREEDLGLELIASLPPDIRRTAVYSVTAPEDLFTQPGAALSPLPGLAIGRMTTPARRLVVALVDEVLSAFPRELADREHARIVAAGLDRITFTWLGATSKSEPHYFRLDGPTFVYEFDNTQENATHVHTVWHVRDAAGGDFGAAILREHYRRAHAQ